MFSSSSINNPTKELAITTVAFTGGNLLIWGTRVATWLNCPASAIGMVLVGVVQGIVVTRFVNQFSDARKEFSAKILTSIAGIFFGTFVTFFLVKPLAAYIGVVTVKAAISSAALWSITSFVYGVLFFPLYLQISTMTPQKFSAFLENLKKQTLSWNKLSIREKYTVWERIIKEKRAFSLPPLPTDTPEKITQMSNKDFQELVYATMPEDKEANFWAKLSLDVQTKIWTRKVQKKVDGKLPFLSSINLSKIERLMQKSKEIKNLIIQYIYDLHIIWFSNLEKTKEREKIDQLRQKLFRQLDMTPGERIRESIENVLSLVFG